MAYSATEDAHRAASVKRSALLVNGAAPGVSGGVVKACGYAHTV